MFKIIYWGGSRAFRAYSAVAESWPSWFAGAPKVASAPSGPGFGTLAGWPRQSLRGGGELAGQWYWVYVYSIPYF